MMAAAHPLTLAERLPPLRGRLSPEAPLAQLTWFRVGGPAELLFRPADVDDLLTFLDAKPADVPLSVIGVASNLLVRDGGIEGVVLRLARGFADVLAEGDEVETGAAALDLNVARVAAEAGIGGLEFLCGVPGTIGGAVRMNAGAYGRETKDVLVWAELALPGGRLVRLTADELGLSYRHSRLPPGAVVTRARLKGESRPAAEVLARMAEIQSERQATQPIRSRTGGSTFANPPGHKAWQLIDAAGCRGLKVGDAQVSEQHCNFLINLGAARAADIEALGEEVRRRVQARSGIALEWEIKIVGKPA
jgi:UDP-N-acetylmuramate dehydrogenase